MAAKSATNQSTLLTQTDAVDLIRFEKNLLQIGFFGAHERRGNKLASSRRIEAWVNRDGKKIKVSAEFRSSDALGLPSTSDRDKYMGFMKLIMETKQKTGTVTNPVRFSGYSLLKVLGQCDSGENYEALNSWGQRMADTTITSEQVIYSSVRKRYMNKTVHVFRSFTRVGSSNLDGTDKTDTFEVELEDWLLENLNESFVVPEDFNMYRKLVRPTAKGIFVYLYLWFYASQGKEVEKDYNELCALLNVRTYAHVSKIKETMGLSLNDLVDIGYLKSWDIRPMSSKSGYKLVLAPGRAMNEVLVLTQRKQLAFATAHSEPPMSGTRETARAELIAQGINRLKATELARKIDPDTLLDRIDYVISQVTADYKRTIKNPAGFLIAFLEGDQSVPSSYKTRRERESDQERRRKQDADRTAMEAQQETAFKMRERYEVWRMAQVNDFIAEHFSGDELVNRLQIVSNQLRKDKATAVMLERLPTESRNEMFLKKLQKELIGELCLPSLDEWKVTHFQGDLF